ncbi:MAG: hypothetical protein LUG45_05335 [Clostridiales bacterium]|nr:hypothetical protein [Clostridiales bacterium]
MDKFISAERMKKGLEELGRSPWANGTEICPRNIAINDALGTVKDLCIEAEPAADVAPVKHGEWMRDENTGAEMVRCSVCREVYDCDLSPKEFAEFYRYCPNCGARMDGGGDNA